MSSGRSQPGGGGGNGADCSISRRVVLQPPALIEGDGGDDAAPTTVGGGEAALLDRPLGEDDLVAEGRHADGLDVDAELARPEAGQQQMRAVVGLEAHHVVGRDLGAEHGVVPVLHREELVLVQHVGRARHVPRHVDGVGRPRR